VTTTRILQLQGLPQYIKQLEKATISDALPLEAVRPASRRL